VTGCDRAKERQWHDWLDWKHCYHSVIPYKCQKSAVQTQQKHVLKSQWTLYQTITKKNDKILLYLDVILKYVFQIKNKNNFSQICHKFARILSNFRSNFWQKLSEFWQKTVRISTKSGQNFKRLSKRFCNYVPKAPTQRWKKPVRNLSQFCQNYCTYLSKQVGALLPCLRPSLEGPINLKTFSVTNMSKCYMMSQSVTSISFLS
jgi:hypothetical protein